MIRPATQSSYSLVNKLSNSALRFSARFRDWTVALCESIQNLMEVFWIDPVREFLDGFDIRHFQESIIMHAVSNFLLLQFIGEQVRAVHIELQTERRPGRDTEVTEPKFFVNEIEIIVETFALVKLKECLSRGLVMPGFISIALFHGGKDVDQPFGLSGFLNPNILAERMNLISVSFSSAMCWTFARICSVTGWEGCCWHSDSLSCLRHGSIQGYTPG